MVWAWFDAREAEAFGNALAEFYDEKSRDQGKATDRKRLSKEHKLLAQMMQQVGNFKAAHSLNAYKKARLGNAFKWRLMDLGHEAELVDALTRDILLALR